MEPIQFRVLLIQIIIEIKSKLPAPKKAPAIALLPSELLMDINRIAQARKIIETTHPIQLRFLAVDLTIADDSSSLNKLWALAFICRCKVQIIAINAIRNPEIKPIHRDIGEAE